MKEYIERKEALRQIFFEAMGHNFDFNAEYRKIYISAKRAVRNTPAADVVEVRHGRWEFEAPDKHGNRKPICPHCKEYKLACWSDYASCNYCPNCGAKMDKEE